VTEIEKKTLGETRLSRGASSLLARLEHGVVWFQAASQVRLWINIIKKEGSLQPNTFQTRNCNSFFFFFLLYFSL